MDVTRAAQLVSRGSSPQQLLRLCRAGALERVRHGAYATELAQDVEQRHRQLIAGTWPLLGEQAVLSHASAGLLHGLPVWRSLLDRVDVTRSSGGHGRTATCLNVRRAPLEAIEVVEVDGYRVTSLERTAVDLARAVDHERAVAVLDAALHAKGDPDLIASIVRRSRRRHGVAVARAALAFADGRAESVGESFSRVRMVAAGLPKPRLQLNVFDDGGRWLARSDFGWEEQGVLGEYDGQVKYVGTPAEVARTVMREKRREDRLRELGWVVVRWGWADLEAAKLRRRILAAFGQGRPGSISGHVEAA